MQLTPTQQQFLIAALAASGRESRVFPLQAVADSLRYTPEDTEFAVKHLERHGYLNRLPEGEAILTDAGRARGMELESASGGASEAPGRSFPPPTGEALHRANDFEFPC
jgi:Mn-dependent DtxR family transcriptional regulator